LSGSIFRNRLAGEPTAERVEVHATVAGVDIHVIGWILMAAGALGLILTMAVFAPRRRRTVIETRGVAAGGPALGSATVTPQNVVGREVRDDVL
jgi:Domain of unknown function (DUF6458)